MSSNEEKSIVIAYSQQSPRTQAVFTPLRIGGPSYEDVFSKARLREIVTFLEVDRSQGEEDFERENDDRSVIFEAEGHIWALRYAIHIPQSRSSTKKRLVLFADGPQKGKALGFGVCYKRVYGTDGDWIDTAYGVFGIEGAEKAETLAIHRALWIAYYEILRWIGRSLGSTENEREEPPRVVVISDCIVAINLLYRCHSCGKPPDKAMPSGFSERMMEPMKRLLHLGAKIEVHWTPGHANVEGNHRADGLASIGADYAARISRFSSFGVENAILPFLAFTSSPQSRTPKILHPIHAGTPFSSTLYWHRQEISEPLKELLRLKFGHNAAAVQVNLVRLIDGRPMTRDTESRQGSRKRSASCAQLEEAVGSRNELTCADSPGSSKKRRVEDQDVLAIVSLEAKAEKVSEKEGDLMTREDA